MTEIRVVVPDALAASDLTWYVHEHAEIFRDGATHTVRLSVDGHDVAATLSRIRDWVELRGFGSIECDVDGLPRTIAAD